MARNYKVFTPSVFQPILEGVATIPAPSDLAPGTSYLRIYKFNQSWTELTLNAPMIRLIFERAQDWSDTNRLVHVTKDGIIEIHRDVIRGKWTAPNTVE